MPTVPIFPSLLLFEHLSYNSTNTKQLDPQDNQSTNYATVHVTTVTTFKAKDEVDYPYSKKDGRPDEKTANYKSHC